MRVLALDAAFPFDREAQLKKQHSQQSKCVCWVALMLVATCT